MAPRPLLLKLVTLFLCVSCLPAAKLQAQQQKLDSIKTEMVQEMLREAHEEVKKNYYDTSIHGLDWDARFQKCNERTKELASLGQGFSLVAGLLDGLNDSHTFFIPPQRPMRLDYGFQSIIIGDKAFILRIRPGTDAEAKLHPGDEIVAYNKFTVDRGSLWKMDYYFKLLSPQDKSALVLKDVKGQQREVTVDAKVRQLKRVMDLTEGSDRWDIIREGEREEHQTRHRYVEAGDVMIWKMPQFDLNDGEVDHLFGIAKKHKALVLDLRENGGGAIVTLERMVGNLFEADVKIADRKGRKDLKPQLAKGRGSNAFAGKVVVLVDSKSASAAELFARVMQLEKRGIVVGDRSSGSVMESRHYPEHQGVETRIFYGFSITDADLIMKDGKSLEHVGVTPDEIVLPTASDLAEGRDPALSRAVELAGSKLDPAQAGKMFPYEWLLL